MKYASSIRYGGELVAASDCTYQDYKQLGLLCPECKEPVFLRAGSTFFRQGKEVLVNPHFAHFSFSDPALVQACENRVAKYDAHEVQRRAAIAKGQRLKILQRWFWDIFKKNGLSQSLTEIALTDPIKFNQVIDLIKKENTDLIENLVETFRLATPQNVSQVIETNLTTDPGLLKSPRVIKMQEKLRGIDLKMHRAICWEVVQFLKTKSSLHLLESCLACTIFLSGLSPTAQREIAQGRRGVALGGLMACLTMIFWAEEFAKIA
ncbi:hypothetical protein [Coleofasciculus sp. FACHB-T130]|uniref:hypothetical protein n=1 Tax=Cyanophyceae TaxID=3028117 RepID=UPI001685CD73|nr:hypothetical protein [Coleofasciculus sp. FACHB-T130]MBD1878348.1 hypothetical protein [Coleofasciculus sp. FACHB-T130]